MAPAVPLTGCSVTRPDAIGPVTTRPAFANTKSCATSHGGGGSESMATSCARAMNVFGPVQAVSRSQPILPRRTPWRLRRSEQCRRRIVRVMPAIWTAPRVGAEHPPHDQRAENKDQYRKHRPLFQHLRFSLPGRLRRQQQCRCRPGPAHRGWSLVTTRNCDEHCDHDGDTTRHRQPRSGQCTPPAINLPRCRRSTSRRPMARDGPGLRHQYYPKEPSCGVHRLTRARCFWPPCRP